jgi:hypothetical protein
VYTIFVFGGVWVQKCILFSFSARFGPRSVYFFRFRRDLGPEVYTIFVFGGVWAQKCILFSFSAGFGPRSVYYFRFQRGLGPEVYTIFVFGRVGDMRGYEGGYGGIWG